MSETADATFHYVPGIINDINHQILRDPAHKIDMNGFVGVKL
jgi:hypothetical protein